MAWKTCRRHGDFEHSFKTEEVTCVGLGAVSATSWIDCAAVTNNPNYLSRLPLQRTVSHPHSCLPPASCCSVPYFQFETKAETEAFIWCYGKGKRDGGSMLWVSKLLLPSLPLTSHQSKQVSWPSQTATEQEGWSSSGEWSGGEGSLVFWNNAMSNMGRVFFRDVSKVSDSKYNCLAGYWASAEEKNLVG